MKKEEIEISSKNTIYNNFGLILLPLIASALSIIAVISIPGIITFTYSQTIYKYNHNYEAYEKFLNKISTPAFNFSLKYLIQIMLILTLIIFAVGTIYLITGWIRSLNSKDKKKNNAKLQMTKGMTGTISAGVIYLLLTAVLSMYRIHICLPFCA